MTHTHSHHSKPGLGGCLLGYLSSQVPKQTILPGDPKTLYILCDIVLPGLCRAFPVFSFLTLHRHVSLDPVGLCIQDVEINSICLS